MSNLAHQINDFVIHVATVNGSGSQSSNNLLIRTLFRMGVPVGGKNLFPSNIAGLPTWYTIRANHKGHTPRKDHFDIVVAMNKATLLKDMESIQKGGYFIYNGDFKLDQKLLREDIVNIEIPFRKVMEGVTDSVKLKKLLTNMTYVGVLSELLNIPMEALEDTLTSMFKTKPGVIEANLKALNAGRQYCSEHLDVDQFKYKAEAIPNGNKGKILVDGNAAAAAGLVFNGCTFASWYPITPSSSLIENFQSFAEKHRKTKNGENTFAIVQAEDELSAICMVAGAGWAGARAMTATSGPGLSLMAEAVGLCYFAEIPAVIWDVQRVGPSTGLPTRTMQGDLLSAYQLSHGDTKHVVLLPHDPNECFDFAGVAFDLAEKIQTPVIVLSDLDIGMNQFIVDEFKYPDSQMDRGKVLDKSGLEKIEDYARYKDTDGDGITYRTLPGTDHPSAAYFTRGTGHDEKALYSEDNENYKKLLDRLSLKWETAKSLVPQPVVESNNHSLGIIAYGSSHQAVEELRSVTSHKIDYLRLRSLPLSESIKSFVNSHEKVFVVDQNRDGQLLQILLSEWPDLHSKLVSIRNYDGLPLTALNLSNMIEQEVK